MFNVITVPKLEHDCEVTPTFLVETVSLDGKYKMMKTRLRNHLGELHLLIPRRLPQLSIAKLKPLIDLGIKKKKSQREFLEMGGIVSCGGDVFT